MFLPNQFLVCSPTFHSKIKNKLRDYLILLKYSDNSFTIASFLHIFDLVQDNEI